MTQQILTPEVLQLIDMAREEDWGTGDITSRLLDFPQREGLFQLWIKQPGVVAGAPVFEEVFRRYDPSLKVEWHLDSVDGSFIEKAPAAIATIKGRSDMILAAERAALNFIQHLSGIATLTRRFVEAVAHTSARILDTRKTTPGWRKLEKYAVRMGGGHNHRMGLYDAVLIKDNHLAGIPDARLAGAVFNMLNRLSEIPHKPWYVEVEVTRLEQARELFNVVGIDVIMLDNFDLDEMQATVELRHQRGLKNKIELEASGGVTLEKVGEIAQTGVERISVGALTHSARAMDLSLESVEP